MKENKIDKKELFGVCPFVTAQKIFSGKWSILIMHCLSNQVYRFGELQKQIPDLTQATLTKQLKYLEEYNMIHREVYNVIPPKVEYSLTDLGKEFLPVLDAFEMFGDKYIEYMEKNS
ncbi:winged helix-turn-helix transcriptional regulator [Anaeromicropila herbilytica]|uniref:Transcriptional regulator n=1 Tax=Anaeromicropila herbilytica TaxID=2785025 RepID=A0A7R7IBT2_9FIRM|nr:helix-turn-helix domain-containing protein [Anaeromicropila herbilytica]BCN29121.1 transcriptional regulator [Anaeromicropila herbilytica]